MRLTTAALLALAVLPSLATSARADDTPETAPPAAKEAPAAPAWVEDFDKAVEQAKAEKKDLLVDFTGSDWCHWCVKLHEEVFSQPDFFPAAKEFVLVSLDFPRGSEALARVPNMARNKELAEKHHVQGYPTILLMTADGDVYGQTGYQKGGAGKYLEDLRRMRDEGRPALLEAIALAKEFDAAPEGARKAVVEKALARLEKVKPGDTWASRLLPAAREASALDPKDETGLASRGLKAVLRSGAATDADRESGRKLDPKNEKGLLEQVVQSAMTTVRDDDTCRAVLAELTALEGHGKIRDKDTACVLFANAAYWNFQFLGDKDAAKAYATKLKAVADPKDPRFGALVEKILGGGSGDAGDDAK